MIAHRLGNLLLLMSLASATGCATVQRLTMSAEDISAKQEKRATEAVKVFDEQRDFAQFEAAQARLREGNLTACRDSLFEMLKRSPDHLEARVLLAEVLLCEEKFEQARQHIDRALTDRPDQARLHYLLGLTLDASAQPADALEAYRKAKELEPNDEQYATACQTAESAVAQPRNGYAQQASFNVPTSPSAEPVALTGDLADAERGFARGDREAALASLCQAMSEVTDNPQTAQRAAMLALKNAEPAIAAQLLQPVADRAAPSAVTMRLLGTAYYRLGDYQRAQQALRHALSLDNSSALAYVLMGCTLEKLGQANEAQAHFAEAKRLDPRLR